MSGLNARPGVMMSKMMQANHGANLYGQQAANPMTALAGFGGMGQMGMGGGMNNNMFGGLSPTQLGIGMNMNAIKKNLQSQLALSKQMGGLQKLSNKANIPQSRLNQNLSNQMNRMNRNQQHDAQGFKTGQRRMMRPQQQQQQQQQQIQKEAAVEQTQE